MLQHTSQSEGVQDEPILPRFMVAEVGVGRPCGTGDCPPELILMASRGGLLEVVPDPAAPRGRAVLPIALAERVVLPMNALPLACYSTLATTWGIWPQYRHIMAIDSSGVANAEASSLLAVAEVKLVTCQEMTDEGEGKKSG
ncbi:MAG: hypothetical protein FRX49_05471 [Trebouxia sp. A1-2]|nr:MAG: hypothetical protein FRX49_05471 [Trebouxia sp. A1-2]